MNVVSGLDPKLAADGGEGQAVRNAADATMEASHNRLWQVLEELKSVTADQIKDWKAMNDSIGNWEDNVEQDPNTKKWRLKANSRLRELMENGELKNNKDALEDAFESKEADGLKKKVYRAAAEEGKESGKSKWEQFKSFMKALLGLGALGFAFWFAYQYAADNTGCFSYVGTLGGNKMGCSSTKKNDWMAKHCNCGGNFTPDIVSDNEITQGTGTVGSGPPNTCALGGDQAEAVGGSYASCTSAAVGPKAVIYAYRKMSPLQALAALPSWLGKFGGGLLGDATGGLKHILMMVLYVGLGIVGVIILFMIIRFAWNYFKTHRSIGKKKMGSSGAAPAAKRSGMQTRSRR